MIRLYNDYYDPNTTVYSNTATNSYDEVEKSNTHDDELLFEELKINISKLSNELKLKILSFLPVHKILWCRVNWFWKYQYINKMTLCRKNNIIKWDRRNVQDCLCEKDFFYLNNNIISIAYNDSSNKYTMFDIHLNTGTYVFSKFMYENCNIRSNVIKMLRYGENDKIYTRKFLCTMNKGGLIYLIIDMDMWKRYFEKYRISNPDLLSNLFLPYVKYKNINSTDDEKALNDIINRNGLHTVYVRNNKNWCRLQCLQRSDGSCIYFEIAVHKSISKCEIYLNYNKDMFKINIFRIK